MRRKNAQNMLYVAHSGSTSAHFHRRRRHRRSPKWLVHLVSQTEGHALGLLIDNMLLDTNMLPYDLYGIFSSPLLLLSNSITEIVPLKYYC